MNKIKMSSIILLILFSFISGKMFAENNKEKTVVFKVDIDCNGCKVKIEDNISYEKGVRDLKVTLDEKKVEITYRYDKTSPEELIKAFAKIGYKAEVLPEKVQEEKNNIK